MKWAVPMRSYECIRPTARPPARPHARTPARPHARTTPGHTQACTGCTAICGRVWSNLTRLARHCAVRPLRTRARALARTHALRCAALRCAALRCAALCCAALRCAALRCTHCGHSYALSPSRTAGASRSIKVLDPLLTDEMRALPAWRSWVKLVELFSVLVQHELKVSDVKRIDDLQFEYVELFNSVPQYAGLFRPKHHFLTHLAGDIWRYGPPRGYWTFGFESFNKVIKSAAQHSNWRNETVSLMQYWSMWSARNLVRTRRAVFQVV